MIVDPSTTDSQDQGNSTTQSTDGSTQDTSVVVRTPSIATSSHRGGELSAEELAIIIGAGGGGLLLIIGVASLICFLIKRKKTVMMSPQVKPEGDDESIEAKKGQSIVAKSQDAMVAERTLNHDEGMNDQVLHDEIRSDPDDIEEGRSVDKEGPVHERIEDDAHHFSSSRSAKERTSLIS